LSFGEARLSVHYAVPEGVILWMVMMKEFIWREESLVEEV
jgi:hypothetical protein